MFQRSRRPQAIATSCAFRDEMVGFEHDAVELYPKRSREVDAVNLNYLWVMAPDDHRFPVAFRHGREILREFGRLQTAAVRS